MPESFAYWLSWPSMPIHTQEIPRRISWSIVYERSTLAELNTSSDQALSFASINSSSRNARLQWNRRFVHHKERANLLLLFDLAHDVE